MTAHRRGRARRTAIVKSGNMSLGVNLLAVLTKKVAAGARRGVRYRDLRDASQQEDRRTLRHRAVVRRGGGPRGARSGLKEAFGARARRPYRRAQGWRHRLCVAARRHGRGRASRHLRRSRGAHRAAPQGRGPHDLRTRRAQGRALGARARSGTLLDARCAGVAGGRISVRQPRRMSESAGHLRRLRQIHQREQRRRDVGEPPVRQRLRRHGR